MTCISRLVSLINVHFYYKIHFRCMKCSLFGPDSEYMVNISCSDYSLDVLGCYEVHDFWEVEKVEKLMGKDVLLVGKCNGTLMVL